MIAPTTTSEVGKALRARHRDMNAAWRHIDVALCVFIALAQILGSILVYSATRLRPDPTEYISKHLMFVALGAVAMMVMAAIDYQWLARMGWLVYVGAVGLLGAVLVPGVGSVHKSIRAWFDIGPLQIQPAEIAKVAVIIAVAAYMGSRSAVRLKELAVALAMFGLPMGLIMLQPDLGTTLVFVVIAVGMLVVAGTPFRYLALLVLVGIVGIVGILQSDTLDAYQKDRLTAFASPDSVSATARYNTERAQEAIATGGLTGKGLFNGPQTKGGFVPEQQTDFIFTVAGEELGFAGSALLIMLLGGVMWRVWRAAQLAHDQVGRLMCVGVLCMFGFHIFENVGMALGIMPVTGIPLPFVSYGGSAIIASYAAAGLVLNVHMRRYR